MSQSASKASVDIESEIASIMGEIDQIKNEMVESPNAETVKAEPAPEPTIASTESQGPAEEIAEALGSSMANVISLKSREELNDEIQAVAEAAQALVNSPEGTTEETSAAKTDVFGESTEGGLDDVFSDTITPLEPVEFSAPKVSEPPTQFAQSRAGAGEGALTMRLSGKMKLNLQYEYGSNQQVTVSFDDDAFRVVMADGAEFKIPVKKG